MSSPAPEAEPGAHAHPPNDTGPEEAAPISLGPDSAFTSDPLNLPPGPENESSLNTELPAADANEAARPPSTPESAKSPEAEHSPAVQEAPAQDHPAKSSPSPDVIDLTMDDDDDVQVVPGPPRQQTPVAIKEEPQEESLVVDPRPDNVIALDSTPDPNAVHNSIETTDDINPEKWQQAIHLYMANAAKNSLARSDHAQPEADLDEVLIESEEENSRAVANFEKLKKQYAAKNGNASMEDKIALRQAQKAENARIQLCRSKKRYDEEQFIEEHAMFFPENQSSNSPDLGALDAPSQFGLDSTPGRRGGAAETLSGDESDLASLEQPRRRAPRGRGPIRRGKKPDTSRAKASKDKVTKRRGNTGTRRGSTRGRGGAARKTNAGRDLFEMSSLLPYDIQEQARLNREQLAQPQFSSKTKAEALAQLIESIPEPQRDVHVRDKNKLLAATKEFNGVAAMKADGNGKWKLRGMISSLHHYQVMGAAEMRVYETKRSPTGGILGDDMGLGKTVMAIANIIDGRPEKDALVKTTLIVTPSSLTNQWMSEIQKHADPKFLKNVMIYRSAQSPTTATPELFLGQFDVVITSYHEIVKSMPNNKPPPHLVTARSREEWWEKHFEENKGALHRMKWYRIVLDEAQAIKNHESKTSEAAWRLRGKFRWALSGTPVQNSLTEFFAYFRFLKMFGTGEFELFKRNYCKKGSEKALVRLSVQLKKIIIRRTHQDTMFGRPILQLPPITNKTIELEFTVLERTIYRIVRDRFIQKIKGIHGGGNPRGGYNMFFALLLRLRQLTAHILLIQKTLKELMEAEDLERLWELTKPENVSLLGESDRQLLEGLQTAIATREQASSPRNSQDNDAQPTPAPTPASCRGQNDHELSRQFRRCLQLMRDDGKWDDANQRSICHFCGNPPKRPHITSCLHIYCFSCMNELAMLAAKTGEAEALCFECGLKFNKTEALATTAFDEAGNVDRDTPAAIRSVMGRRRNGSDDEETLDWYQLSPVLQSTKTRAAVKQMESWFAEKGGENDNKILVFSQFRGVLRIFGHICKEKGWLYESFHGDMSFDARNKAIKRFTDDDDRRVLLAAMKAGGVGLNLTAANRVILIDLWWNIAAETQAFCRVFRIGQEKDVEVVRFAVKNTVDIDIIKMQERKKAEIESAMHKRNTVGGLSTAELLRLFGDEAGEGLDGADDEPFVMPDDPYARVDSDVDLDEANAMVID